MKLTTLKVSVPVLMMMLFQSGYGVSDWFGRACVAAINDGDTLTAQRIMVENNPSSVTMSAEAKKDFVNELKTLIKETIDKFVPREFDGEEKSGPRELFKTEAMNDMLGLQDVTADTVKDSFTKTIAKDFFESNYWKEDPEIGRIMGSWMDSVEDTWGKSEVPPLGEGDVIPESLLGTDGDTVENKTIRGFLKTAGGAEEVTWRTNWATLISHEEDEIQVINALTMASETVTSETATLDIIKNAATTGGATTKERAIYDILVNRAEEVREAIFSEADLPDGIEVTEAAEIQTIYDAVEAAEKDKRGEAAENGLIDVLEARITGEDRQTPVSNFLKVYLWMDAADPAAPATIIDDIISTIDSEHSAGDSSFWEIGANFEELLRHSPREERDHYSEEVKNRRKALVEEIAEITDESTDDEKVKAVKGSVETLDGDASKTVAQAVKDIHQADPSTRPEPAPEPEPEAEPEPAAPEPEPGE